MQNPQMQKKAQNRKAYGPITSLSMGKPMLRMTFASQLKKLPNAIPEGRGADSKISGG